MTGEEAIKNLQTWLSKGIYGMTNERLGYLEGWFHEKDKEAFNMAIQALEQDTVPFDFELYQAGLMDMPKGMVEVLDKIRAEITVIPQIDSDGHSGNWYREPQAIIDDALQIINKYIGDTE